MTWSSGAGISRSCLTNECAGDTTFVPSPIGATLTVSARPHSRSASAVTGVLAIIPLGEGGYLPFLTPDLSSGPSGMVKEVLVPLREVAVDSRFRVLQRPVIAIVDN